jgi:hypothetical protein
MQQNNQLNNDNQGLLGANNGLTKRDMVEMNFVNVPTEKQKISITKHMKFNQGTTPAKSNEQIVVESGELNVRFRLKLISIERINVIFDEIRD